VILDPVIHGVAADELCVGHGLADATLEDGIDVSQEEELRVAIRRWDLRLEAGEDIKFGCVGLRLVEVLEIGGPKSSPTTAMTRTSVKKLADREK
jgi:hypothetical protein